MTEVILGCPAIEPDIADRRSGAAADVLPPPIEDGFARSASLGETTCFPRTSSGDLWLPSR
jgi:hypothetical protein